ncbi:MAG: trypsin-like peptidase domain-containing protein [Bacteroidota bacterium]
MRQTIYFLLLIFLSDPSTTLLSQGVIDLSDQVQDLQQKSASVSPNIIALPILDKKQQRKELSSIPWLKDNGVQHITLALGTSTYSHIWLDDIHLSDGEWIELVDATGQIEVIRPDMVTELGRFLTGPQEGDVEIRHIGSSKPNFTIHQVYAAPNVEAMDLGFGAAFDCQININCEQGEDFSLQKSGVMRIQMVAEEGIALCTGTLMNNTRFDNDPLVLTAYHCLYPGSGPLTPMYDMWSFDFNYESFSCADPESEPIPLSIRGAEVLAEWQETDMMMLRIQGEIPSDANVYYNGWDRRQDHRPDRSVLIHHPAGDIKKITIDNDALTPFVSTITWNNNTQTPAFSHFVNDFDEAVYQPGSSGAGLFDDAGQVIGQLHGGPLSDELCGIGIGYSGRLSESWDGGGTPETGVRNWLDPIGSGVEVLEGIVPNLQEQTVQFQGRVVTPLGIAIPDVRISLSGDKEASFLTGADGRFVFDNLTTKNSYTITLSKDTNPSNGLSAVDIISIQNHILDRRRIESEFGLLAADVNNDGRITSIDLVQIRNVIIGRAIGFTGSDSWRFSPDTLTMSGENIGSSSVNVSVIGYKVGDANGNANPRN